MPKTPTPRYFFVLASNGGKKAQPEIYQFAVMASDAAAAVTAMRDHLTRALKGRFRTVRTTNGEEVHAGSVEPDTISVQRPITTVDLPDRGALFTADGGYVMAPLEE